MIPDAIRQEILHRIRSAEAEHGVRVLLAVESGSRAWGFASPNSDYDARFIYVHPRDWYLAIDAGRRRDVIEYPIVDDIDLSGWDLRKALGLFAKSNPAFVEWIQSPIVYIEHGEFAQRARELLPAVYSVDAGIRHYRSMAIRNCKVHLQGDQVQLKKYFYVLRPLLAVRWLRRYGRPAPIEFGQLLHLAEDEPGLLPEVHALLERKRMSPELGKSAPVAAIGSFIERELARLAESPPTHAPALASVNLLDGLFRELLRE